MAKVAANPAFAGNRASYPSAASAWYAVGVMSLVNALDNVDRGIISLLIEPIKKDLQLSDTQMSLLIGIAFSGAYALVGLPMSRFADTGNRKRLLAFGVALWSSATAAASLARSFTGLAFSRALTGAGESLKGPNALSIISDIVPREKYPTAMSIYNFGIVLGSALSLIIGGTLIGAFAGRVFELPFGLVMKDWQMVFLLVGLPGILVALLIAITIREPDRRGRKSKDKLPVSAVFRFLKDEKKVYFPFMVGSALMQIEAVGLLAWRVPFYERTFGWGPEVIGPLAGTLSIFLTPIGLFLGAWLGERMAKAGDAGAMLRLSLIGSTIALPISLVAFLMPDPWLALSFSCMSIIAIGIAAPGAVAALQTVTPNEFRGQLAALYLFTISVVGNALGPLSVALFTDHVFQDETQLRYAMVLAGVIFGGLGLALKLYGFGPYKQAVQKILDEEAQIPG